MRLRQLVVEAVPPPPPLDRGIYLKSYIGQANPDVGSIWTEGYNTDNTFKVFHDDIKSSMLYGLGIGWQHSHWLRFDLTGEYRGDALFVGQDRYQLFGGGTDEYTADIQSWLGLANAYIDLGCWRGFTPYVGAGIGFATISVNGLEDVNTPQGEHVLRRRPHHHELRLGAVRRHELRHQPAAGAGSVVPLCQPRHRQERCSHRLRRLRAPTAASSSRTSRRTICCWASATSSSTMLRSTP